MVVAATACKQGGGGDKGIDREKVLQFSFKCKYGWYRRNKSKTTSRFQNVQGPNQPLCCSAKNGKKRGLVYYRAGSHREATRLHFAAANSEAPREYFSNLEQIANTIRMKPIVPRVRPSVIAGCVCETQHRRLRSDGHGMIMLDAHFGKHEALAQQ